MNEQLNIAAGVLALFGTAAMAVAAVPPADAVPGLSTVAELHADPDTTGAAIWAHIQEEGYQENWSLWPGKGEMYEGGEPHGMLLTTYVNDVALAALEAGETIMPAGAIVIKENYRPSGELVAITVMYKKTGYNPDFNDWFFTKHMPDGTLDTMPDGMAMEGRLPGCQSCHSQAKDRDYLVTERPATE